MEQHVGIDRTKHWIAGALLALFCTASHAAAQTDVQSEQPSELSDLSLEELADLSIDSVSGASSYNQKVTEAPSSITIVTADEIRQYGYRTLADVLRSVRGFYVTYDRNYSFLGVRGFSRPGDYNARVLLLVDGHRLNDNIFGAALVGTEFPLDVDLVERVEIIRGPSSSLYGTSAFFAVINVITRRGDALGQLEATGSVGSLATRKARVTYGHRAQSGVEVLLSASRYGSDGDRRIFFDEFNSPDTNHGVAENADADQFSKLLSTVTYKHVTFQALYGSREKAIPTASFGTVFNDPRSRTLETQAFVDLQYNRSLAAGWQIGSRVYYDRYAYDGDYVYESSDASAPGGVLNRDFARGNWWGSEFKLTKRVRPGHIVAAGAEYRNNFRQDQFNYDEAPYYQHLDDRRSSTNWAVYLQDELLIHPRVLVNLGVRHDNYETFGGTTNPRAGVIYSPLTRTTVKILYGQAFRAPNAYELFWHQEGVAKSNPDLRPERNRTTELVVEQYVGRHLRFAATGFHYGIKGLITQQTDARDGLLVYDNIEDIRAKGVEVEVEGRWSSGLRARLGHTLEDTRNRGTGLGLTNSPRHLANANLIAPLFSRRLSTGLELQYVGARQTIAGNEVAGGMLANLTLFGDVIPGQLDLSASVYNLFDRKYHDPGSEEHRQDAILQYGRTLRVKATFRLP
jgi:outer membrane receptor for ferrienterochelin and colicins